MVLLRLITPINFLGLVLIDVKPLFHLFVTLVIPVPRLQVFKTKIIQRLHILYNSSFNTYTLQTHFY